MENDKINLQDEQEPTNLTIDIQPDSLDLDTEEQVEHLCRWAAARAAAIVMVPFAGTVGLIANEVYLIKKIGELHGQELNESIILGFIASLGATVVGSTLVTLIPYSPTKILVGVGLTYGVGKAAHEWLKAGRPNDVEQFKKVFISARDEVKRNVEKFVNNPNKNKPLGDETKEFEL